MTGATTGRPDLAFKAYEIEEYVAVYVHRPLGMVAARGARLIGLTPNIVTLVAIAVGIAGGALLARPETAFLGFLVLVLHGILDSSDGQLARMTGQMSEFGRVLDGVAGYFTHIAIYLGILWGLRAGGTTPWAIPLALVAAVANIVHAQLYDYHRTAYEAIAINGRVSPGGLAAMNGVPAAGQTPLLTQYERMARVFAGRHPLVEAAIARRASGGVVRDEDRARYRRQFYALVRGWNLLGDNTRFYAIGLLALIGHVEWFFAVVLVLQNAALGILSIWQEQRDREFLRSV